ncbi:MAG TPA: hypothetical protein VG602_01780 [Actinomycetota bacterium]|nr:hypothetical protein [Actinomycetota bacterium]
MALLAIFFDAALGHGLTWENDPYWSYWITKTFLIATIFGLGTAWFGIGEGRGAAITAVHTVVLTVYYWTFSPIGLPSSPEWLDLEHTWITGVPIHFAVIYLGYLVALWLWRRRARAVDDADSRTVGVTALVTALAVVVVAGGAVSLALGDFPGVTWFLVRLLLTVPFLLWWWAWAGRDRVGAVMGGLVLALVWSTYGHFLGPAGLPDTPLRIFSTSPPPATVEFLDYRQLWLISFPLEAVIMAGILLVEAMRTGGAAVRRPLGAFAVIAAALFLIAPTSEQTLGQEGARASLTASGSVMVETGRFYEGPFARGTGDITIEAEDQGSRVTPLPPQDVVSLDATIETDDGTFEVTAQEPMVSEPTGKHTTWWGVGLHVEHHGESGIGSSKLPPITSEAAGFALGDVAVDGDVVAAGVPVHFMTAESGLPGGATLELDVGSEGQVVPGLPDGHLRVLWAEHEADIENPSPGRYLGGGVILLAFLIWAFYLARREAAAG